MRVNRPLLSSLFYGVSFPAFQAHQRPWHRRSPRRFPSLAVPSLSFLSSLSSVAFSLLSQLPHQW